MMMMTMMMVMMVLKGDCAILFGPTDQDLRIPHTCSAPRRHKRLPALTRSVSSKPDLKDATVHVWAENKLPTS